MGRSGRLSQNTERFCPVWTILFRSIIADMLTLHDGFRDLSVPEGPFCRREHCRSGFQSRDQILRRTR